MSFERPSLSALATRIRGDFRTRLGVGGSLLRRAMANVLATVWAGAAHLLHGHIAWVSLQLFAATASREFLIILAQMYNMAPLAATFATGNVLASGTDGEDIPVDTIFVRDDGESYKSTALVTIASGSATVPVTAVNAGLAGNLDANEVLTFESPIANIDSTVTVDASGLAGGDDVEKTEDFRTRLKERISAPPQGGNDPDYVGWAKTVLGVTRVWVYRHEDGLGTVKIRFVRDNDTPSIFPDAGEVAAVQAAIDAQRPTTAEPTVAAPADSPVAFTIDLTPNTSTVQAAVAAELDDLFFRDAAPGDGAGFGKILLSRIHTAIGVAEGVEDYTLTVPAADVSPAVGDLPTRGTITWV